MIQNLFNLSTSSSPVFTTNLHPTRTNQEAKPEAQSDADGVILSLSPEAQQLLGKTETGAAKSEAKAINESNERNKPQSEEEFSAKPKQTPDSTSEISPEEEELLRKLKQNDLKVRTHERQHMAAAGGYVRSGPVYEYIAGPNGKRYAVGGRVSLDMSPVPNNPEATIRKAQIIKNAALAPADPSGADRAVAASAENMEAKARKDLQEEQEENLKDTRVQGYHRQINFYYQSRYQPGQALNILI